MKLTYDLGLNTAYLRLKGDAHHVRTVTVAEDLNVDLAADGSVCGIEFLNANEQLVSGDDGKFVVIDEAGGTKRELAIQPRGGPRRVHAR